MKTNRFYVCVAATMFFLGISCSCNGKGGEPNNAEVTEAAVNDSESLNKSSDDVVPFKDSEVVSEWGNNTAVITIYKKDGKIFLAQFTKETKKYTVNEVEEFQADGMAGYRFKKDHDIEFMEDCGAMINYVKGEEKDSYEWIR